MTEEEHKERHILLHRYFDELLADWINDTGELPSDHSIKELMTWSYEQTLKPTKHEEMS